MKINVEIDRISIKVEGGEEQWYTLEAARFLQAKLEDLLGPVQRERFVPQYVKLR